MNSMTVKLPDWLYKRLRECAKREGVTVQQLISSAATEKLAALMTERYLETRARRGNRKRFLAALKAVPDAEPEAFDRLPGGLKKK